MTHSILDDVQLELRARLLTAKALKIEHPGLDGSFIVATANMTIDDFKKELNSGTLLEGQPKTWAELVQHLEDNMPSNEPAIPGL